MQKLMLHKSLFSMLMVATLLTGCSGSGEFEDLQSYVTEASA